MATGYFTGAIAAIAAAGINFLTADIRALLVDVDALTVPLNLATTNFLNQIDEAARIGASPNLTGRSVTDGTFRADNTNLGSPAAGTGTEVLVLYLHTGDAATSRLIHMWDEEGGLPLTTNGQQISTNWHEDGVLTLSSPRLYLKAAQALLSGALNLGSGNYVWYLVDTVEYGARDDAADDNLNDIPSDARIAVTGDFTPTISGRQVQVPAATLPDVTGAQSSLLVLVRNTGDPATSTLVGRWEGHGGLPTTPNGNNISVNACNLNL